MTSRRRFLHASALLFASAPLLTLSACQRKLSAEFVIVGSGPAGIALADQLAARGKQALVLEGGTNKPDRRLQTMHEVEAGQWGLAYDFGWATQRLLGGTTNLWQSHSPRPLAPELLSASLRGYAEDWPLTLAQLTPWLASAERWLRVRPSDPDLNPALPRNPYIDSSATLRSLLNDQGYQHLEPGAYGMVAKDTLDALRLLEDGEIDRVGALPGITLRPGTVVRRIIMAGDRAVALECADLDGNPVHVEADKVIVCAGGVQTPRLLWNSHTGNQQVGNHSDWLGAGFMEHPGMQYYGRRRTPLLPEGARETHVHVRDMLFDDAGHGLGGALVHAALKPARDGGEFTMIEVLFEQEPSHHNRILPGQRTDALGDPLPRINYRLSELDQRTLRHGEALQKILAGQLGDIDSSTPVRPGSHHLMGSTRMAPDPAKGVVDTELCVWGTDNLYIASSAVFPTSMTVPPTLILVALAQRLATHLVPS